MHRALFLGSIGLAFVAGAMTSRLSPQAQAANELTPMVIHVPDLAGDKLGIASGTGLRSKKMYYVARFTFTFNGVKRHACWAWCCIKLLGNQ